MTERDFVNQALEKACEVYDAPNKGAALFRVTEQWLDSLSTEGDPTQEVFTPIPDNLEKLCGFELLQKIVDPKDGQSKWFCLKNQGLEKKGKPDLMSDGKDRNSIQKICAACKMLFKWREDKSKAGKVRLTIQKFGDMPLDVILNVCNHPASTSFQVNLMNRGTFYCKIKDDNVTIQKICIPDNCEYLVTKSAPFQMKDTEAFKEVTKQLEDLTK